MAEEKHPGLTPLQQRFVEEYIANNFQDAKGAALRAGAAYGTARNAYDNFLGSSGVSEEIEAVRKLLRETSRDKLLGIANEGIDALREVIIDKDAPASAKVSAAKAAIELSGVGAPKEITQSGKQEIVVRYLESKDK